jgi:hypothetical protein
MGFPGFNFQQEILWTGSMAHEPGGALRSTVDQAATRTRGAVMHRWCSARGCSRSPVLTGSFRGGRGS